MKVCTYCSKIVLTYLKSPDVNSELKPDDLQALQKDLTSKLQSQTNDGSPSIHESASPQRKVSVGYQEERLLTQPKYPLSHADRKNILQQSSSLKVLYEDMTKVLPNQNRGAEIINYLITKNKSSNKSQAIAILTAMIEAGYIIELDTTNMNATTNTFGQTKQRLIGVDVNEDNSSSNQSSDNDILHEFNENGIYKLLRLSEIMSNSGTFQLNLDVDSSSVHISKPETNDTTGNETMNSNENIFFSKKLNRFLLF